MFIIVKDEQGHGIPEVGVRLVCVGITNPDGSNQSEYRHTDEAGNCAWTWYPHDAPGGYDIVVNDLVQNPKPQYNTVSKHVSQAELEGSQQVFTLHLNNPGVNCPVNHDKQQFTDWFNKVKVGSVVTNANMVAMVPELQKCGMLWQNQGIYPADQWRPRIHQPPIDPNTHDSNYNVDCGDFGGSWKLTFRY